MQIENKIKLNCKDCESFYIDAIPGAKPEWKLEYYKLTVSKRCCFALTKKLELRIMSAF